MTLTDQASDIAALAEAACSDVAVVYSLPPATVETRSIVVSPSPEWGDWTDGTFCAPDVAWELVLVAATTDYAESFDWFYDRIAELAADDDLAVTGWSQPELISLGSSGEGLAVRVRLAPRPLDLTGA